ncbi:MAG TPA: protein kinase, partial [Burkholderiales bacterium]|nr:protein kinase [Burkholderiales bacterium]
GEDGKLRILDFSVALDAGSFEGAFRGTNGPAAGTPSFLAPELFDSPEASVQSDLYAAGVTLYYLLTRKYPYGEVEPFQHPRFGEPAPASRLRPDIPQWLDDLLLKAVSRERKDRFETAEEFQLALERGQQGARRRRAPLAERNPIALWQGIAAASVTVNVLLIYFYFAT